MVSTAPRSTKHGDHKVGVKKRAGKILRWAARNAIKCSNELKVLGNGETS